MPFNNVSNIFNVPFNVLSSFFVIFGHLRTFGAIFDRVITGGLAQTIWVEWPILGQSKVITKSKNSQKVPFANKSHFDFIKSKKLEIKKVLSI